MYTPEQKRSEAERILAIGRKWLDVYALGFRVAHPTLDAVMSPEAAVEAKTDFDNHASSNI